MNAGTDTQHGRFPRIYHPWHLDSGVQAGMTVGLFARFRRNPGTTFGLGDVSVHYAQLYQVAPMLDFSKNHFALFGLPLSYRVDSDLLAQRYRALQQALHPDRYAAAGDREKRLSLQASTHVNEALQTIRDPVARARYLLSLYTGDQGDKQEATRDAAFLMEQMVLREALAEVKDHAAPMFAVGTILDRIADQFSMLTGELEALLEEPSAQDLEAAREYVRKLQFIAKCRLEAEALEAKLEGIS